MTALPPDTVAYVVDYEEKRSRLSTFFRFFTALPHLIYLTYLYSIPVFFVLIAAWFTVVFTGRYPEKMYHYLERFMRYSTLVNSYYYLATDHFPPFNGRPETPYQARFLLGPPKEKYSRAKAFFRIILLIPVYIIAYAFSVVAMIGSIAAWFVVLFTGKMPRGLQEFITLGLSYLIRAQPYYMLHTEAWPKFTDQQVAESLAGTPAADALLVASNDSPGSVPPPPGAFLAPGTGEPVLAHPESPTPPPPPPPPPAAADDDEPPAGSVPPPPPPPPGS